MTESLASPLVKQCAACIIIHASPNILPGVGPMDCGGIRAGSETSGPEIPIFKSCEKII